MDDNRMTQKELLAKWAEEEAAKAEQLKSDLAELGQYRSTGLSPVQVRAINNSLTIMRSFVESVDSDEYSLAPVTSKAQDMAQFWEEEWDK